MKTRCILPLFVLLATHIQAQLIHFNIDSFKVDAPLGAYLHIKTTLDSEGRRQGQTYITARNERTGAALEVKMKYVDNYMVDTTHIFMTGKIMEDITGFSEAVMMEYHDTYYDYCKWLANANGTLVWWKRNGNNKQLVAQQSFSNNSKNGLTILYFPDGKPKISYTYDKGLKSGPFTEWFENGQVYRKGNYHSNSVYGPLLQYNRAGRLVKQHTCKGCESDTVKQYYETSGKLEKEYQLRYGKMCGYEKTYYEKGPIKTYTHYNRSGRKDSVEISYYENGRMQERATMEYGMRNGPYESWYENGQTSSRGSYVFGDPSGKWIFYKENGKVEDTQDYGSMAMDMAIGYENDDAVWDKPKISVKENKVAIWQFTLKPMKPTVDKKTFKLSKKYPQIRIRLDVDSKGNGIYYILTPMKDEQKAMIESALQEEYYKRWEPLKLEDYKVPVSIYMTGSWHEK